MFAHALTLHRLRIFMTVVEQGSFNRAAQELLMSQAAVSQQIKTLEDGLALPLFERSPQGVTPTAAGQTLYDHGGTILTAVLAAAEDLSQLRPRRDQKLSVAATSGISVYILPPWLRRFKEANPDISLSLQTGLTHEVADLVAGQKVDFGLIAGGLEDITDVRLSRRTVRAITYQLVVPPGHGWAAQKHIDKETLTTASFLNRRPASRTRRWLREKLAELNLNLKSAAEFDTPDMVKAGVLNGLGIAILPHYVVEKEISRGDLVAVAIDGVSLNRPLELLWHSRRSKTEVHQRFVDVLESENERPVSVKS